MSGKYDLINKLKNNRKTRESYLRAKININLPSQMRALRLRRQMKQEDLARETEMMQPRISAMERPGATKFNLETLIRLAAAFKVGLIVKFVSFSEMLKWENDFSQDIFNVPSIDEDVEFQKEEREQSSLGAPISPIIDESTRSMLGENPKSQQEPSAKLGMSGELPGVASVLTRKQSSLDPVNYESN